MAAQAFVDSVIKEIIQPGVDRLMESRYFTELRQRNLSKRRLQGLGDSARRRPTAQVKNLRSLAFALGMTTQWSATSQQLSRRKELHCRQCQR
jgi:hypothetical protein